MALISSDQITITDIRDSISCEISSSNGVSLLDASQGTILTCHLYGADGEIDIEDENEENLDGEYLYFWTKKEIEASEENEEEEKEEFFRTGKSIELTPEDLKSNDNNNSFTFYCNVYSVFLEEDGQLVAHGEITLDSTIKKWMEFDEKSGLWVYGNGNETNNFCTLTDNVGFHIYEKLSTNTTAEIDRIRRASFSTTTKINKLQINDGKISLASSSSGGLLFTESYDDNLTEKMSVTLKDFDENLLIIEDTDLSNIKIYNLEVTINNNYDAERQLYVFNNNSYILNYSYVITSQNTGEEDTTLQVQCLIGDNNIILNNSNQINLNNYTEIFTNNLDHIYTINFILVGKIKYQTVDFNIYVNFSDDEDIDGE